MKILKINDKVIVDMGHKEAVGVITEIHGKEYISVKHDNFKSEVFKTGQITLANFDEMYKEVNSL